MYLSFVSKHELRKLKYTSPSKNQAKCVLSVAHEGKNAERFYWINQVFIPDTLQK